MIHIPSSAHPDIRLFLDASLDELNELADYVTQSLPLPDIEDLVERTVEATGLDTRLVESVLTVAINIAHVMSGAEAPAEIKAERFAAGLADSKFSEWEEKYAQAWEERKSFLVRLLTVDSAIGLMAKARSLLFEAQCVLQRSAVITDIRHVYNEQGEAVKGALILHTLGLSYIEGGDTKELHLTLSPQDVESLTQQLQRAKRKAEISDALLAKMAIPELTPKRNLQS